MIEIDKTRIITNRDLAERDKDVRTAFENLDIDASKDEILVESNKILIIDPCYLADFYNENGEKERFLKQNGVVLMDFGGDVGGQIVRTSDGGIMMVLLFDRTDVEGRPIFSEDDYEIPENEDVIVNGMGCDSGSYIFIDYSSELSIKFNDEIEENFGLLSVIDLPNGRYRVGYEQWDKTEETPYEHWRRNLVVFPV